MSKKKLKTGKNATPGEKNKKRHKTPPPDRPARGFVSAPSPPTQTTRPRPRFSDDDFPRLASQVLGAVEGHHGALLSARAAPGPKAEDVPPHLVFRPKWKRGEHMSSSESIPLKTSFWGKKGHIHFSKWRSWIKERLVFQTNPLKH